MLFTPDNARKDHGKAKERKAPENERKQIEHGKPPFSPKYSLSEQKACFYLLYSRVKAALRAAASRGAVRRLLPRVPSSRERPEKGTPRASNTATSRHSTAIFRARPEHRQRPRPRGTQPPRPSGPDSRAPPNNNATHTTPRATKTPRNKGTPRAGTPRDRPLQAVSHGATKDRQRREKLARFAGFVQILLGGGKNRHADRNRQAAQATRPHHLFSRSGNRQGHPAGEDRRRTAPHRPSQPERRKHRINPTI